MSCVIPAPVWSAIERHLVETYPREGCGLLVGRERDAERVIEYAVLARNGEPQPSRRYSIPPEEFLVAERAARARGLEVVGFFHSHPDGDPEPSESDAVEAWPHYTYLIVGVGPGRSRSAAAWRLEERRFASETMRIADAHEVSS